MLIAAIHVEKNVADMECSNIWTFERFSYIKSAFVRNLDCLKLGNA